MHSLRPKKIKKNNNVKNTVREYPDGVCFFSNILCFEALSFDSFLFNGFKGVVYADKIIGEIGEGGVLKLV